MPVRYVDSSALAKRYFPETGSSWLRNALDPNNGAEVYIGPVTPVEVISTISRRERGGTLSPADATGARVVFDRDFQTEYHLVELSPSLRAHAMLLAETHGLRGYDAIQLAAALEVKAFCDSSGLGNLELLSADQELNAAAIAEGITVEDPNDHP